MKIREATSQDYNAVWDIFEEVVSRGDAYVFDPLTRKEDLAKYWFAPNMKTYVLVDKGEILATYFIKPNQIGLGSHIANCGYAVRSKARGKGIGKLLCEHSLENAKTLGYLAMQFNMVVSTNHSAIKLWEKCGFQIIGTIPKGFNHQKLGLVDAHIMYREI